MPEADAHARDIKHTRYFSMDVSIRAEFGLSKHEYTCLLNALHSRFGVQHIEDIAFLSVEQLAAVTDHWEAAAVKRLFAIAKAHIGVEKLYRAAAAAATDDPGLVDVAAVADDPGLVDICSSADIFIQ